MPTKEEVLAALKEMVDEGRIKGLDVTKDYTAHPDTNTAIEITGRFWLHDFMEALTRQKMIKASRPTCAVCEDGVNNPTEAGDAIFRCDACGVTWPF